MKIKDSIALVTGASSGIGQASAERLANAGYKVYGTSRRGAQAGQRSFAMLPLDVTSDESVEAAVNEIIRQERRRPAREQRWLRRCASRSGREFDQPDKSNF
jgi:NAD(P)-dependent dehydrogenase (short-subunit alcohol dehydrogenase family)